MAFVLSGDSKITSIAVNVAEFGGRVTTTKVYLGLDSENATRETTYKEQKNKNVKTHFFSNYVLGHK